MSLSRRPSKQSGNLPFPARGPLDKPRSRRLSRRALAKIRRIRERRDATRPAAANKLRRRHRWARAFVRWFLNRRYDVRVRCRIDGVEVDLASDTLQGPMLVLPNHPAYIDPAVIMCHVPIASGVRPLVYESTFRHWLLRPLMRAFRAIEVPELNRDRRASRDRLMTSFNEIISGLRAGEAFLVYPSGRLQRGDVEWIGPARSVHDLARRAPSSTRLVLIRSRGLWGSSFSCASTGDVPHLSLTILKAFRRLVASGLFWLPKRKVELTVELVDLASYRKMSRSDLNAWLEAWYNADGGESPNAVPYHQLPASRMGRFAGRAMDRLRSTKRRKQAEKSSSSDPAAGPETHP